LLNRLARTLERSQLGPEFHNWGTMLLLFALIIFGVHLALQAMTWDGPPYPVPRVIMLRILQFILMGFVFFRYRPRTVPPTTPAERQLWSIWIAFLATCWLTWPAYRALATLDRPFDDMDQFIAWAFFFGIAFFALGSTYWGWCFAFGVAFFALAVALPWQLRLAPLTFGTLWSVSLVALGLHLPRLAGQERHDGLTDATRELPPKPMETLPAASPGTNRPALPGGNER
jgi:hypothetical protein